MASTSKAFKIVCGSVSSLFDTRWHKHNLCIFIWARSMHVMSLRGNLRALWVCFYEKALLSSVPLFEEREAAVCFPRFGTNRCRGTEANEIVGFAVGYGRWVREGPPPFRARRPRTSVSCWNVTMRSFWHHQIQRLVLCWVMPSKSRRCLRAKKLRLNPLNPPALHMTSYWRLWSIK